MNRREVLKYLSSNGCEKMREGKKHSIWFNPILNKKSSIPRHNEISDYLFKKICKDLGLESEQSQRS